MKIVLFWFFLGMNSVALTDGRKWDFLELEKQKKFHPPEHYNGLNFEIQDRQDKCDGEHRYLGDQHIFTY